MAPGKERMRRLGRRQRHLLRVIRRSRHSSVQNMAVHELQSGIDRRHGLHRLGRPPRVAPGATGHWRPLTRKARQIISQLRRTRVWKLQKQLVRELGRELEHGRRLIDRARDRLRPATRAAMSGARRAGRWTRERPARVRAARKAAPRIRRDPAPARPAPARAVPGGVPHYPARARARREPARRPRAARPAARHR